MTKAEKVISMLADWTPAAELMAATGWQAHTLRGALSTQAKKRGLAIERQRIDGVTSYRIKPAEYDSQDDIRKSVNVALATVKERKAQGGPSWPPE